MSIDKGVGFYDTKKISIEPFYIKAFHMQIFAFLLQVGWNKNWSLNQINVFIGQTQCVKQTNMVVEKYNDFFLILSISQITDFICRLICRHWSINYSITICFLVLHYIAFISQLYCTRQNQLFIVSLVLSITTKLQRIADSKQSCETNTFGVNIYLIY